MSWDELDHMLSKFNFNFNWEYSGDLQLRSLLKDVFRILEGQDERSLEQVFIGCVHQACPGLTLNQPKNDPGLPYEMKFTVHPSFEDFCITKIVILSEARNLELYINGGYEKSSRGIMLTMNKGKKLSLFEAEFDLSCYINTISNATVKFLSFPCKNHMKLQAVVMKVEKCEPLSNYENQDDGPVDLASVKHLLGSVGRPLSDDARKMLQSIENYQKSPAFKAQQLLSSQKVIYPKESSTTQGIVRRTEKKQAQDEKGEEHHQTTIPEEDMPFMNMLAELGMNESGCSDKNPSKTDGTSSSTQSRWTAYLKSRVRANKNASLDSPLKTSRSMSDEGSLGVPEDHLSKVKSRQRPNSIGCVNCGEMDRTFNPETLRKKWLQEAKNSRCSLCGCPGCLSVYNSVTANIFAAEERILEKVDAKFVQLQGDVNKKFDSLVQLLVKREEVEEKQASST